MSPSDAHADEAARTGIRHRLFAALLAAAGRAHGRMVHRQKIHLLGRLAGTVVEIGPGAGINLGFYREEVRWIGAEPNVHLHRRIRDEAERLGRRVEIITAVAEDLPFGDVSVDAVVSTLVLCSVSDVSRSLTEIRRILKPGGRFVYIEHVAAERGTATRTLQRLIKPVWKIAGGGCHPDRETGPAIEAAGFAAVDYDRFRLAVPVVGPHIAGVARKE